MKISREVKTAILVISGIVLFIYLFNYLKGENLLDSSRTYYTVYDNVEGLAPSTPVTINGFSVGKVQDISFTDDGSGKLLVKLLVDNDFKFSKNSKAQLYDLGLIGGKGVAIIPAFDNAEIAKSGSYLESSVKGGLSELVNQRLTPLQEKIETMMVSADSLLSNLNDVFDEEAKANLRGSIAGLNQTISSFKSTSETINKLLKDNQESLNSTLANAENLTNNLSKITDSVADANLGATLKNLQQTVNGLNSVLASIDNGEGTIGKLLKDDALYKNLEGASKEMELLLLDIKLHPARYRRILSKKEIPYQAPTEEQMN
ncbi:MULTISPECIES: MlaD family protein [Flavobacteriaceae]|uniref:MlaD family protein n=2 Tax=Flavobacteriaceae TaxID=49546 RepID=A0ABP3UYH0_9FLAO|nr:MULTISPECIES: MlaD family protein [Flavobacteriaceae]RYH74478.1 MCE family protein [Flavobacteriaceae bacterium 144Ye]TBV26571.1 MCE family protein [Meridianimaribacter sp. CL38]TDY12250.1 phospholipid/cholesterol/gamma-HCH transport system substrate-binding protein [Meridianimaribacter flavus]